MEDLRKFLSKFSFIKNPALEKQKVQSFFRDKFQVEISLEQVKLKSKILKIQKLSGPLRNKIFFEKENLKEELNNILEEGVEDIIF